MRCVCNADGVSSPSRAYTTEEYLKITEEQLKAAAAQQQGQTSSPAETQTETQTNPQGLSLKKEAAPSLYLYKCIYLCMSCSLSSLSHAHVCLITATAEEAAAGKPSSQQSGHETWNMLEKIVVESDKREIWGLVGSWFFTIFQ